MSLITTCPAFSVDVITFCYSLLLFRGRTVICAYSIEDIDQAFSTSKLKGYSSPFIGSRPGMVRKTNKIFWSFSFFCHTNLEKQHWEKRRAVSQPLFRRWKDWSAIFETHELIKEKQFWTLCPRAFCLFKSPAWSESITSLLLSVCPQKLDSRRSQWHQEPRGDQIPPRNWGCDPACWCGSTRPAHRWPNHTHCGGHCPRGQRWALQRPVPRNRCVCMYMCVYYGFSCLLWSNSALFPFCALMQLHCYIEKFFAMALSLGEWKIWRAE